MTGEKVKYDPQTDTLTLQLGDTPIKESDEIAPGLIVDYDASGQIVGVELLHVTRVIAQHIDEMTEKAFIQWLHEVDAIREDGTIDLSKLVSKPAQTFEELEDLLDRDE